LKLHRHRLLRQLRQLTLLPKLLRLLRTLLLLLRRLLRLPRLLLTLLLLLRLLRSNQLYLVRKPAFGPVFLRLEVLNRPNSKQRHSRDGGNSATGTIPAMLSERGWSAAEAVICHTQHGFPLSRERRVD
jgi:hypothetical protein